MVAGFTTRSWHTSKTQPSPSVATCWSKQMRSIVPSLESFSGSVAIAVGIGAGVAGSGAEATTKLGTKVHAFIEDSTVQAATGNITVDAGRRLKNHEIACHW